MEQALFPTGCSKLAVNPFQNVSRKPFASSVEVNVCVGHDSGSVDPVAEDVEIRGIGGLLDPVDGGLVCTPGLWAWEFVRDRLTVPLFSLLVGRYVHSRLLDRHPVQPSLSPEHFSWLDLVLFVWTW
jgi:hypothetical protein